jgi:hypothetical protein
VKVKELINQLSKLPKDLEVTIPSAYKNQHLRACHKIRTSCLMKVVNSNMSWQFIIHDKTFHKSPDRIVVYLTPATITNNFKFIQNMQECREVLNQKIKKKK